MIGSGPTNHRSSRNGCHPPQCIRPSDICCRRILLISECDSRGRQTELKKEAPGKCKLLNCFRRIDLTRPYRPPPRLLHNRKPFAQQRLLNMNLHKVAVEACSAARFQRDLRRLVPRKICRSKQVGAPAGTNSGLGVLIGYTTTRRSQPKSQRSFRERCGVDVLSCVCVAFLLSICGS